ncbi:MAG: hypothetical protein JW871_07505 [Endomicrobiales bacterium]|nr:hypothetical protein [Endomicrobiales bacterium]
MNIKFSNPKTYVFLLVLIIGILFSLLSCTSHKIVKPQIIKSHFIWHWHDNTYLEEHDAKQLKNYNIKGVFFQIGNFSYYKNKMQFDGFNFKTDTFQRLRNLNEFQTHLVFTFANEGRFPFVRHFNHNTDDAIDFIVRKIESQLNICRHENLEIKGIQLDMEGRLNFSKYKKLIDRIINKFGEKYLVSICVQSYWIKQNGFSSLIEDVDFIVPMLYDYQVGFTKEESMKVTNISWINRMIDKYKKVNKPFYVGIPAYSYSKIYDHNGKKVEMWAGLSVEDLSENPDFRLVKTKANRSKKSKHYKGDNDYVFKAIRDTSLINYKLKKGAVVKFNILTVDALKNYIKVVNENKTENLLGISIFRFGYPWEDLIISNGELGETLGLKKTDGSIPKIEVLIDYDNYSKIYDSDYVNLNIKLQNIGCKGSFLSKRANRVNLEVEHGWITDYDRGGFDNVRRIKNTLIFEEYHLEKSEVLYSGIIRILNRVKTPPLVIKVNASSLQLNGKTELNSNTIIVKIDEKDIKIKNTDIDSPKKISYK